MSKRGDEAKVRAAAIALRRVEGQTGTQIAEAMGVSRQRVYQMLKEHGYDAQGVRVEGATIEEAVAKINAAFSDAEVSVDAMQAERAMRAVSPGVGEPVLVTVDSGNVVEVLDTLEVTP